MIGGELRKTEAAEGSVAHGLGLSNMFHFVADARQMTGLLPSPSGTGPESVTRNTTMNVQGICCPSEVPLINRLLKDLPGVSNINVNVTQRTTTVTHDNSMTSATDLVRALNSASLDASVGSSADLNTGTGLPRWNVLLSMALFLISMVSLG